MGVGLTFIEVINDMSYFIAVPIIFVIVGFIQIIKCLFFERIEIDKKEK